MGKSTLDRPEYGNSIEQRQTNIYNIRSIISLGISLLVFKLEDLTRIRNNF